MRDRLRSFTDARCFLAPYAGKVSSADETCLSEDRLLARTRFASQLRSVCAPTPVAEPVPLHVRGSRLPSRRCHLPVAEVRRDPSLDPIATSSHTTRSPDRARLDGHL